MNTPAHLAFPFDIDNPPAAQVCGSSNPGGFSKRIITHIKNGQTVYLAFFFSFQVEENCSFVNQFQQLFLIFIGTEDFLPDGFFHMFPGYDIASVYHRPGIGFVENLHDIIKTGRQLILVLARRSWLHNPGNARAVKMPQTFLWQWVEIKLAI